MVLRLASVRQTARVLWRAGPLLAMLAILAGGWLDGSALAQQRTSAPRPTSGPSPSSAQQPPKDIAEPKDIDGLFRLMVEQRKEARFTDALSTAQKLLALVEKQHGSSDKVYAHAISYVAQLYNDLNRASESEALLKRALAIYEGDPASEAFVAAAINNLGFQYQRMGNIDEAERLYARALRMHKDKLPSDHPNIAVSLSNIGRVYRLQGRLVEAETVNREALSIREAKLKPDDPLLAESLENLSLVLELQDRLADAEALLRRAVELRRKVQIASHPDLLSAIAHLGQNLYRQRSFVEAQTYLVEALQARQRVLPAGHELIATSLFEAALNDIGLRNASDAKSKLGQALAIRLRAPIVDELAVAPIFTALADVALLREDYEEELDALRKGTEIYVAHAAAHHQGRAHLFRHIAALWRQMRGGKSPAAQQIFEDSFALAQQAHFASSAAASARLVSRLLSNNPLLGELVDKRSELRKKDLPNSLQPRPSVLPQGRETQQRKSQPQKPDEQRFTETDREVRRKFPDYVDIAMPGSSPIGDTTSRLRADEALVQFQCGSDICYAWVVTREQRGWRPLDTSPQRLDQAINAMRAQLEPDDPEDWRGPRKSQAFDLALAYRLYGDLLGPFEGMLAGKTHLLVVASGSLSSLPLQLLVTDKPEEPTRGMTQTGSNAAYAAAAWLVKRHAISVLPSVGVLKYRERKSASVRTGAPLIGFAMAPSGGPTAPRLTPPVQGPRVASAESGRALPGASQQTTSGLRGYWRYWAGSQVNLDALKRDLTPLVGIDNDMKAIASAVGGRSEDLHLGGAVTVTSIKATNLTPYRFIYFGTHALVAGEIRGTGEPGLVVTLPTQMSAADMGLLTASDISQLKIGADLVLLPRTSTLASESLGADALSVLARGFMHAGARALVATHWPSQQDETSRILVRMMAAMKVDRTLGPAEALRQVTMRQIADPAFQAFAHPRVWAPFMVVGDGASLE